MLTEKMRSALETQIHSEFHSSYLYLAMSCWCEEANLPGFAKWLKVQHQEEWEHALKLMTYMHDRGAKVSLATIEHARVSFKSPLDVFEAVLAHEKKVTAGIYQLYEVALGEKDYASQVQIQWFITEQVEEEKTATHIVDQLRTIPEKGGAMIFMDKQLGKRAAT